jgi:hypothetical protein
MRRRSLVLLALVPSLLAAGTLGVLFQLSRASGEPQVAPVQLGAYLRPALVDIDAYARTAGPSATTHQSYLPIEADAEMESNVEEPQLQPAAPSVEVTVQSAELEDFSPSASSEFNRDVASDAGGLQSISRFNARTGNFSGGGAVELPEGQRFAAMDTQFDTDKRTEGSGQPSATEPPIAGNSIPAPSMAGTYPIEQDPVMPTHQIAQAEEATRPHHDEPIAKEGGQEHQPPHMDLLRPLDSFDSDVHTPAQPVVSVPEPESLGFFALGLLGCLLTRRKQNT